MMRIPAVLLISCFSCWIAGSGYGAPVQNTPSSLSFADAVKGGGVCILSASGTYVGGTHIYKDTIVEGNGAKVQLAPGEMISVGGGAEVTFRNFTVAGGKGIYVNDTPGNHLIADRLTVDGSSDAGLMAKGSLVSLTDCRFKNCIYGVNLYGSARAQRIYKCEFDSIANTGMILNNASMERAEQCIFRRNQKNAIQAGGNSRVRIFNSLFEKNRRETGTAYCISIQDSLDLLISACEFRDSDRAIYLNDCSGARILHSRISGCEKTEGITVQGTECNITISSCEISGCKAGAAIVDGASAVLEDCIFRNNVKGSASPYKGQGIYAIDSAGITIGNCIIKDNDNEGIYISNTKEVIAKRCRVENNGWGAQDGNGINIVNSPGSIIDTLSEHNYLFGVQIVGHNAIIRGCEIRRNRTGGINISANAANRDQEITGVICAGNPGSGSNVYELNCNGSNTKPTANNNLFCGSSNVGVFVQQSGLLNLTGNVITGNSGKNINVYKANINCGRNVLAESDTDLFLNGAPESEIHNNDFLLAELGADSMGGSTTDFTRNWWGSDTGPYSGTRNPTGKGTPIRNIDKFEPWNKTPVSWWMVQQNYALKAGAVTAISASRMPFLKVSILSGANNDSQILAAQASSLALFPQLGFPGGYPARAIHLWINASHETRFQTMETVLELNESQSILSGISKRSLLKYSFATGKWQKLQTAYSSSARSLKTSLTDIQGYYLILDGPYTAADPSWNTYN